MSIIIIEDKSTNRNNVKLFNYNNDSLVSNILDGPNSTHSIRCENEYVTCNSKDLSFNIDDSFSISAWFKTDCTSGSPVLISKINKLNIGYEIVLDAHSGKIVFQLINTIVSNHIRIDTIDSFNDNIWHNIVVTWDGENRASIYIDGEIKKTSVICDTLSKSILNKSDFQISGKNRSVSSWSGLIADVAVFNQVLSQEKIIFYYKSGIFVLDEALVGYWDFKKPSLNKIPKIKQNKTKYYIITGFDPNKKQYHSWKINEKPNNNSTDITYDGTLNDIHISASYIK